MKDFFVMTIWLILVLACIHLKIDTIWADGVAQFLGMALSIWTSRRR